MQTPLPLTAQPPVDLPEDPTLTYVPYRSFNAAIYAPNQTGVDLEDMGEEQSDEAGVFFDPSAPISFGFRRLIAIGGFGEIWEATQCTLNRPVAVKRMRQDLLRQIADDPQALRRYEHVFRQEALITAALEHPNIVPVHDLGLDEEGHPLLAMKLVRGQPWDKQIKEEFAGPVPQFLTKHLPILLSVCQAVAFAHSRGVIHRDIKPSQVMVGEFGEVQLMDWGIALRTEDVRRLMDVTSPATPGRPSSKLRYLGALNPSGTVSFMAPEQTEPTVGNIGKWTDIYLLGGTLYFLLTGRVPHAAPNSNAAFYQASQGMVVPPRERSPDREIPEELAEIAMGAMALDPAHRISSVEEFIQRLTDYLSGVSKRRESIGLSRRVWSVLQRPSETYKDLGECHTDLDRALFLWPENPDLPVLRETVVRSYARTAIKLGDLTLARLQGERLTDERERAQLLEEVAELEVRQREAATNLEMALGKSKDLINFMILDLHQNLRRIGRLDLLEKAAHAAIDHFQAFPEVIQDDHDILQSRCQAMRNIADVFKDQGKLDLAIRSLLDAEKLARTVLGKSPDDPAWLLNLSDTRDKTAAVLYEEGDLDEALVANEEGLRLRAALAENAPGDLALASRLCWSYHQRGVLNWRKGRQEDALRDMNESIRRRRHLIGELGGSVEEESALAYGLNSKTWVLRAIGDLDGALELMGESITMREQLATRNPESLHLQADIAWALKSLALLHQDRQEHEAAVEAFRDGLSISRRLSESDPTNLNRRMEVAFSYGGLAQNMHLLGHLDQAENFYQAALAIQARLVEQRSRNSRSLRDYIYNLVGLSNVLFQAGRLDEARKETERALWIAEELVDRLPGNPIVAETLGRALHQLGRIHQKSGRQEEGRECWTRAVELLMPHFHEGKHPAAQEETLAKVLLLLGRKEDAKPIVERLRAKNWTSPELSELLGVVSI